MEGEILEHPPSPSKRDRIKNRTMELPSTGSTIAIGPDGVSSPTTTSRIPSGTQSPNAADSTGLDAKTIQNNQRHLDVCQAVVKEYESVFPMQKAKVLAAPEIAKALKALRTDNSLASEMMKSIQQGNFDAGQRLEAMGYIELQKEVWALDDRITKKAEPSIDSVITAEITEECFLEEAQKQKAKKKELSRAINDIQPRYQEFVLIIGELCKEFKSASKSTSKVQGGTWIDTDYAGPTTPTNASPSPRTPSQQLSASMPQQQKTPITDRSSNENMPETQKEIQYEALDDYQPDGGASQETQFLKLVKGRKYKLYTNVPANTQYGGWVYCQALEGSAKGKKGWAPETYLKQVYAFYFQFRHFPRNSATLEILISKL